MKKPTFRRKSYSELRGKVIKPRPLGIVVAVLAIALLSFKLFTLVPFTSSEHPQNLGSASTSEIKKNILFGPEKGAQFAILKYFDNDAYIRVASAVGALIAALLLYFMLRKWYTARISLLTSIMFISSSWFLHQGRLVNTEVMYLGVMPALMLSCMWILSKRYDSRLPIAAVLTGLALYVPGTWIFILAGLLYFRKYLWRASKNISTRIKLLSAALFTLTFAPLIYSFIYAQKQIIEWLGYDTSQSFTPQVVGENFLEIPKQLILTGPADGLLWLKGTPILDIFTIVIFALGLYAFRAGHYPAREKLVFGALILGVLSIGIGGVVSIGLLLPVIYIVAANGLAYLLQSWFTVFPKNPVARYIGIALLTVSIGFSCFYNMQRYFVAWPKADTTKSAIKDQS